MRINNKNNRFEKITLVYLLIMGVFSCYLEHNEIWNVILLLDFFLLFLLSRDYRKSLAANTKMLFLIPILFVYVFLNVLQTSEYTYLVGNMLSIIKVLIISLLLIGISFEKNDIMNKFLKKSFVFINLVWIFNIIALVLQTNGSGFMIKDSWLSINSFYKDHCSGIFGNSGTHILSAFSIFIFIYNFWYSKESKKIWIKIYTIVTAIIMMLLSTLNDNNAIFVLYGLFAIYYLFKKFFYNNKNMQTIVMKTISVIVLMTVTAIVIIYIPVVNNYIKNELQKRVDSIVNVQSTEALGSNERLAIVEYATRKGFGLKFGTGLGAWPLTKPDYLGFAHFGLSSIGAFVSLGGFIFYLIILIIYTNLLTSRIKKGFVAILDKAYGVFMLVVLSIYTIIFTSGIIMLWIVLAFIIFDLLSRQKSKDDF